MVCVLTLWVVRAAAASAEAEGPIIDCHSHVFPRMLSAGANQRRFVQYHIKYHGMGWFATEDGSPMPTELLAPPPGGHDFFDLPDRDLRVGDWGRMLCTDPADGKEYGLQWGPPILRDYAIPAEMTAAMMDGNGVAMAVLQHDQVYGNLVRPAPNFPAVACCSAVLSLLPLPS